MRNAACMFFSFLDSQVELQCYDSIFDVNVFLCYCESPNPQLQGLKAMVDFTMGDDGLPLWFHGP